MSLSSADQGDAVIRLCSVNVREPDIHDPSSDVRRLSLALAEQYGIFGIKIGLGVLKLLQKTLRRGNWTVEVGLIGSSVATIAHGFEVDKAGIQVEGAHFPIGRAQLALNVGHAILEGTLADGETGQIIARSILINPLARFGADPMSRIAVAMSGGERLEQMTDSLRVAVDGLVHQLTDLAGIDHQSIINGVFIADPVTHHILLGLDPSELGGAPFANAISQPLDISAFEIGCHMAAGAMLHALPLVGGHVGSNAVAAAYHVGMNQDDKVTLLISIGTTTEIVMGSKGKLFAAAPPAGSVLDGGQIEAGRHSVPGAIDAIRIDPISFEPRFRVVGSPLWSDEPGFDEAVETLNLGGFCRSGLVDVLAELRLSGLMARDGTLDVTKAQQTARIREEYRSATYLVREANPRIAVTQHDIRALQLGKSAIQAAVRILLKRHGGNSIDRVVLTGAAGTDIDPLRAALVGLFPDCVLDNVQYVAHAAMRGAEAALNSHSARNAMADLARNMVLVETVLDPDFQNEQIGAMGFPHRTLGYPLLGTQIELIDNDDAVLGRRGTRRSRGA